MISMPNVVRKPLENLRVRRTAGSGQRIRGAAVRRFQEFALRAALTDHVRVPRLPCTLDACCAHNLQPT